jgi:hypothetical protein
LQNQDNCAAVSPENGNKKREMQGSLRARPFTLHVGVARMRPAQGRGLAKRDHATDG